MSVIPVAALTVGALLLALGLSSSSRNERPKRRDGGDSGSWSDGGSGSADGSNCDDGGGGDGGGCD